MFEPKMQDLRMLSGKEADVARANQRRTEAAQAEKDAVVSASQAEQFAAVRERLPNRAGGDDEAVNRARMAKAARARADALHALAGTGPEDFRVQIVDELRRQLQSLEVTYVQQADKAQHPEAYATGDQTAESLTHDAVVTEEAVLAIRRTIDNLDPAGEFEDDEGED